jgi:hypothetical protein
VRYRRSSSESSGCKSSSHRPPHRARQRPSCRPSRLRRASIQPTLATSISRRCPCRRSPRPRCHRPRPLPLPRLLPLCRAPRRRLPHPARRRRPPRPLWPTRAWRSASRRHCLRSRSRAVCRPCRCAASWHHPVFDKSMRLTLIPPFPLCVLDRPLFHQDSNSSSAPGGGGAWSPRSPAPTSGAGSRGDPSSKPPPGGTPRQRTLFSALASPPSLVRAASVLQSPTPGGVGGANANAPALPQFPDSPPKDQTPDL